MHDRLISRYILECVIETEEPLHIGAGKGEFVSAVDNPVVKVETNDDVKPIIPGSSIRGVLRSHFTRIVNSLPEETLEKWGIKKSEKLEEIREFPSKDEKDKEGMMYKLGTLDKFFGIPGLASPLKITDAEAGNVKLSTRTHVKIDISTDRVEKGKLFTVEFVEGTFNFKIIFDELDGEHFEDVNDFFKNVFLKAMSNGIELHLGGMKSRGYGLCQLKLSKALRYTPEALALGEEPEVVE